MVVLLEAVPVIATVTPARAAPLRLTLPEMAMGVGVVAGAELPPPPQPENNNDRVSNKKALNAGLMGLYLIY